MPSDFFSNRIVRAAVAATTLSLSAASLPGCFRTAEEPQTSSEVVPEIVRQLPEMMAQFSGENRFVYVSQNESERYSYDNMRIYVGTPGEMQEFEILSFRRLRDGGTTMIKTEIGEFYFPTATKPERELLFHSNDGSTLTMERIHVRGESPDIPVIAQLGIDHAW